VTFSLTSISISLFIAAFGSILLTTTAWGDKAFFFIDIKPLWFASFVILSSLAGCFYYPYTLQAFGPDNRGLFLSTLLYNFPGVFFTHYIMSHLYAEGAFYRSVVFGLTLSALSYTMGSIALFSI
jgi:hypothetical protein